jgi:hypothetical protein
MKRAPEATEPDPLPRHVIIEFCESLNLDPSKLASLTITSNRVVGVEYSGTGESRIELTRIWEVRG